MEVIIFSLLITCLILFMIKMIYLISTALVLPQTQGALYVSTTKTRIKAILSEVKMGKGEFLIDLGCGDGRVLRMVSRRYDVKATGYELNPMAYLRAKLFSLFYSEIKIKRKNFWDVDISKADVVFCYLFPDVLKKMSEKVKKELKPGGVFISCNFPLHGLSPEKILRPGNSSLHNDPVYIYRNI